MSEADILKLFSNFNKEISLPEDTIKIISILHKLVTSPNYSKAPLFKKKVLKPTKLPKVEGLKKDINKIRAEINKITVKNYDNQLTKLKKLLENINEKDKEEVCEVIFKLASSNKFFSELYAKLFIELDKEFSMKTIFDRVLENYMNIFKPIDIINCKDYDKFCEITKKNEQKLALSNFYTNMMVLGYLSSDIIMNILNKLQSNVDNLLDKDNNNLIDQLSENIFVIIKSGKDILVENRDWDELYLKLVNITKLKKDKNKGLTHKSKFKYMDIIDLFKKKDKN